MDEIEYTDYLADEIRGLLREKFDSIAGEEAKWMTIRKFDILTIKALSSVIHTAVNELDYNPQT